MYLREPFVYVVWTALQHFALSMDASVSDRGSCASQSALL